MNHRTQPFPQAKKNETGKKHRKHQLKNGTKPSPFQKKPSISIAHQNLHLPFFFVPSFSAWTAAGCANVTGGFRSVGAWRSTT